MSIRNLARVRHSLSSHSRNACLTAAAVAGLAAASSASGQALYEPFDYGTGAESGTAANYANQTGNTTFQGYTNPSNGLAWFSAFTGTAGSTPNDDKIQAGGSLTQVTGLAANAGDQAGTDARNTGTKQPRIGIGPTLSTSGTMYYSMSFQLTNLTGVSATSNIFAGFNNSTGTQTQAAGVIGTRLQIRQDPVDTSKYNIGLAYNAATPTIQYQADGGSTSGFKQYSTSDTVFVVGGYTINGGAVGGTDDTQSLWINPDPSTFGAGTAPAPTLTTSGGDVTTGVVSFLYRTATAGSPTAVRYDELRVDQAWAQVTPAAGSIANATGNWGDTGTWNAGGVPDGAAKFAYFNGGGATVTVEGPHSVGTMTFRSPNSYTVGGSGTLTLDPGTGGTATINLQATNNGTTTTPVASSHTINAPLAISTNLAVHAGTSQALKITGGITGTGNLLKDDPGSLEIDGGLNVAGGVSATNGTVILHGTNTYSGTTSFIAPGSAPGPNILAVDGDAALGTAPSTPTNNIFLTKPSSNLTFRFDADTDLSINRRIVVAASGGGNGPTIDPNGHNVIIRGDMSGSIAANLIFGPTGGTTGGTLFLRGNNTLSAGGNSISTFFINGCTVNVDQTTNFGIGNIQLNGGTGVLQFNQTVPLGTRTISFGGSGGTLDTPAGVTENLDTSLLGASIFNKTGAGILNITGTVTHTGTININGGTTNYVTGTNLGNAAGALTVNNPNTGPGTDVVLNLPSTAGTTRGNLSGTIAVPSSGTNTATINNNGQLFSIVGQSADATYQGKITGAGGFTYASSAGKTLTVTGASDYTGGTTVQSGKLVVNRLHENNAVNITGGTLEVADSSPTLPSTPSGNNAFVSRPSSLTIANDAGPIGSRVYTGTLDLGNNDLILDYTGAGDNPAVSIEDAVRSGFNASGMAWQGTGITSSTAANIAASGNYALAVADNALLTNKFGDGTGGKPQFDGQNVDDTTVIVKFTHRVDLDLDGFVTPNDAIIFATNYIQNGNGNWITGDVDYDGKHTQNDAIIFATFYNGTLPSLPEPGIATVALGAAGLLLRRGRRA